MKGNNLDELAAARIFLQINRAGNLSRAARVMGLSTSSLTRQLQNLESHLGTQLMTRTTRRLRLTEAGQVYLLHAERLLDLQREAHEAIQSLTGGVPRGRLRVSMPVLFGDRMLGPNLAAFHQRYPELNLELDLSDRSMPLVEGGFDLGLRIGRLKDSALRAQRLSTLSRVLVASPSYLAERGAPEHPEDLHSHDCLTLGLVTGDVRWGFWKSGESYLYRSQGWLHCTSPSLALGLAIQGSGISRLPVWVAQRAIDIKRVVPVLPDWSCDDPERGGPGLYAIYTQGAGTPIPLKSRVFVEFVKEVLNRYEAT